MNGVTRMLVTSLVLGAGATAYAVLADSPRPPAPGIERRSDAALSLFMREAQAGRGTTATEIQRRAAEIAALGRTLREERRLHGEAATRLLTDAQRERPGEMAPLPAARGGMK